MYDGTNETGINLGDLLNSFGLFKWDIVTAFCTNKPPKEHETCILFLSGEIKAGKQTLDII